MGAADRDFHLRDLHDAIRRGDHPSWRLEMQIMPFADAADRPRAPVHSYNKDGAMRYDNPGDPVYAPNSAGGPAADPRVWQGSDYQVAGEIVRSAYTLHPQDDDFGQPRALWEKVLDETGRDHLVSNIAGHAGAPEVTAETRSRVADYWRKVQPELGARVAKALNGG